MKRRVDVAAKLSIEEGGNPGVFGPSLSTCLQLVMPWDYFFSMHVSNPQGIHAGKQESGIRGSSGAFEMECQGRQRKRSAGAKAATTRNMHEEGGGRHSDGGGERLGMCGHRPHLNLWRRAYVSRPRNHSRHDQRLEVRRKAWACKVKLSGIQQRHPGRETREQN